MAKLAAGWALAVRMGDGKEKRKIPVISFQAIDLPITYDTTLRGDSKPFPTGFFGISPM
jgi:hypothetical protein